MRKFVALTLFTVAIAASFVASAADRKPTQPPKSDCVIALGNCRPSGI